MSESLPVGLVRLEREFRRITGMTVPTGQIGPVAAEWTLANILEIVRGWSPSGGGGGGAPSGAAGGSLSGTYPNPGLAGAVTALFPTADEKAALDGAAAPDGANPFATMADVGMPFDPLAIASDLLPAVDVTWRVGSPDFRWAEGHFQMIEVGDLPVASDGNIRLPFGATIKTRNETDDGNTDFLPSFNPLVIGTAPDISTLAAAEWKIEDANGVRLDILITEAVGGIYLNNLDGAFARFSTEFYDDNYGELSLKDADEQLRLFVSYSALAPANRGQLTLKDANDFDRAKFDYNATQGASQLADDTGTTRHVQSYDTNQTVLELLGPSDWGNGVATRLGVVIHELDGEVDLADTDDIIRVQLFHDAAGAYVSVNDETGASIFKAYHDGSGLILSASELPTSDPSVPGQVFTFADNSGAGLVANLLTQIAAGNKLLLISG